MLQLIKYINDPLIHTIEVENKNYNLIQIEWRKTDFSYNKKPIGLTLHLIHSDYKTIDKLNIIIPLDFVENINNVESFKNINYRKMDSFFALHTPTNVENINVEKTNKIQDNFNLFINYNKKYNINNINTNLLLKNNNDIPIYECCKNTIGKITHMNLCLLKTIIELNDTNYMIKEENGNVNIVIEPNIINKDTGLLIRSYIEKDTNLIYLK